MYQKFATPTIFCFNSSIFCYTVVVVVVDDDAVVDTIVVAYFRAIFLLCQIFC